MFQPSAAGLSALQLLWNHYETKFSFTPVNSEKWSDEFFFCLLGGYSISFELNKSAFQVLKNKGYFDPVLPWDQETEIAQIISNELRSRQFLPKLANGQPRAYRFPNQKAVAVARAGKWLKNSCEFRLEKLLANNKDAKQKRNLLMSCPGFGYKTSSWFLRNIGYGDNLAILDIHVFRTLRDFEIIPPTMKVSTDYMQIEDIFCDVCKLINVDPGIMDLVIWYWSRETSR